MHYFNLIVAVLAPIAFGQRLDIQERGIDVRSGFSSTHTSNYSSSDGTASIDSAINTGANAVRVHQTYFFPGVASSRVMALACDTPGRLVTGTCTEPDAAVKSAISQASNRGATTVVSVRLEPDWEIPSLQWQPEGSGQWQNRRVLGQGFTESQWSEFFGNLTEAAVASANMMLQSSFLPGSALEVGAGLDAAVADAPAAEWAGLITKLRAMLNHRGIEVRVPVSDYLLVGLPSSSTDSATRLSTLSLPSWLGSLDSLALTSWSPLVPWGASNDSVASFETAWTAIADQIGSVSASLGNKPVVIAEAGFQSRWHCWERPNATVAFKIQDCARHADCYHMACQDNGIAGLLQALHGRDWLKGVYLYGWTTDPTFGGTYDWSHTPHGKPAEETIRRWYGNYTQLKDSPFYLSYADQSPFAEATTTPRQKNGPDGATASSAWVGMVIELGATAADEKLSLEDAQELHRASQQGVLDVAAAVARKTREATETWTSSSGSHSSSPWLKPFDGAIFGTGQYGNPLQQVNGPLTKAAVANAKATGMRSIEIMVAWFETTENDTVQYPIRDPVNPMMTVPDEDLQELLQYAKGQGFNVIFTPFLDFNFFDTRACHKTSPYAKCPWRGDIGRNFGSNCSAGTKWDAWWSSYSALILHYAALAERSGVDLFLVEHELYSAAFKCEDRWIQLVSDVRKLFSGKVGAAFNYFILDDGAEEHTRWVKHLDVVGIDIYAQYQGVWHDVINGTYGPLPYQQSPTSLLHDTAHKLVRLPLDELANWTGIDVLATENGFGSRPFSYGATPNNYMGLPYADNCDVHARCYSIEAQALGYSAIRDAMEGANYWLGLNVWTMHDDPTSGGPSDSSKCPIGKPASLQAVYGQPKY